MQPTQQRESLAAAEKRAHEATTEFQALETTVASVEEGEEDLDTQHESATEAWDAAKERLSELKDALNTAMRERDTWAAKAEALELSLARKDGAGALLAEGVRAVRGTVASLVEIEAGAEDVESSEEGHTIWCADTDLNEVSSALEAELGESESTKLAWRPTLPANRSSLVRRGTTRIYTTVVTRTTIRLRTAIYSKFISLIFICRKISQIDSDRFYKC